MHVLVTGAAGMLGTDVCAALEQAGHEAVPTGPRAAFPLDVTIPGEVREGIRFHQPDAVIHCAAYTKVDLAESESESAFRVNALGSWAVAAACAELDVP